MTELATVAVPTEPSLGALVRRAVGGDQRAGRTLFDDYSPSVMGYCVLATNGDREAARDLTQDIFVRVFRGLPNLREPDAFEGWLWTIARREAQSRGTSRSRYAEVLGEFELDHEVVYADDDKAGREQRIAAVRRVLEEHDDERVRSIALLKYTEPEHTTREIAAKLGIPHGTVTVTLMRFRERVQARLLRALESLELDPVP